MGTPHDRSEPLPHKSRFPTAFLSVRPLGCHNEHLVALAQDRHPRARVQLCCFSRAWGTATPAICTGTKYPATEQCARVVGKSVLCVRAFCFVRCHILKTLPPPASVPHVTPSGSRHVPLTSESRPGESPGPSRKGTAFEPTPAQVVHVPGKSLCVMCVCVQLPEGCEVCCVSP